MDIKKLAPWNWFKKEEESGGSHLPVKRKTTKDQDWAIGHPLQEFHSEIDRLFDRMFKGFGLSGLVFDPPFMPRFSDDLLKPTLDLGATDKEYTIAVEIPGVNENDVQLEIVNDTMTIRGEKKQEKEEKEKNYYRMERSYGSFQRMLSLPEDADQENVAAVFKNGVLTVILPRKDVPKDKVKQIKVRSA